MLTGREDRVEISVIPVDSRPPVVDLHGLLVGDGMVRWTILADEKIGSATLLLDEGPLVPVKRGARAVTWQHKIDEEYSSRLRAVIVDESGNMTKVERTFRAGMVGAGRVLESADGALRVLKRWTCHAASDLSGKGSVSHRIRRGSMKWKLCLLPVGSIAS